MPSRSIEFDDLSNQFPNLADTAVIRRSFALAREQYPDFLLNHVVRSWLFASFIAEKVHSQFDHEVVAVSTLLHDLGLVKATKESHRFEVTGANAARDFVREQGFDDRRAQLVWDAVALHATADIAVHKEPEVAISVRGIGTDFGRDDFKRFTAEEITSILDVAPRCNMKHAFKECLCAIARDRPETTYNNFVRQFGERFVPGYHAPSTVDLMMNGPFSE
jgi:hypothetical protein